MAFQKSELSIKARKLATEIGRMTAVEREAVAEKMPTVCNPAGHFLTMRNTILLCMQADRSDLTMVAGFKQWVGAGRIVRKGEHALGLIQVPLMLNRKDADGKATVGDKGEKLQDLRFRWVPVFDVSQTDELRQEDEAVAV